MCEQNKQTQEVKITKIGLQQSIVCYKINHYKNKHNMLTKISRWCSTLAKTKDKHTQKTTPQQHTGGNHKTKPCQTDITSHGLNCKG